MRQLLKLVLLVGSLGACYCSTSPGEGEKVGQIVSLKRVGMFCQTWEAQLIRGGFTDGSGTVGTIPFDFTLENDAQAQAVQRLMNAQREVRVRFRKEGISSLCRSEGTSAGTFALTIDSLVAPSRRMDAAPSR